MEYLSTGDTSKTYWISYQKMLVSRIVSFLLLMASSAQKNLMGTGLGRLMIFYQGYAF
jgi:hypothetical protein